MEFVAWPKTPRLLRDMTITEKLDGTNSAIVFSDENDVIELDEPWRYLENGMEVGVQSRSRMIYPGKTTDNYGFAGWVYDNKEELFDLLGPGRHYGEWWGKGIQRNYGQETKRFSLFNLRRHEGLDAMIGGVPVDTTCVLHKGVFDTDMAMNVLLDLSFTGSAHAPGFDNPEGIVVFHEQASQVFKLTFEGDRGKWELGASGPTHLQGLLEAERTSA